MARVYQHRLPTPPAPADGAPKLGDMVLFRIKNGVDAPVDRPLLVTDVAYELVFDREEPLISGELFILPDADRTAEWVQKNTFYLPTKDQRTLFVKKAYRGDKVGQWRAR